MKGYSARRLADIDVELKEAVCDALVSSLISRVSGTDAEGAFVFGRSPHRTIVSGQLLPRFDARGEDETSDIRIAAIGIDFLLHSASTKTLIAEPAFFVYLRVLPRWEDIEPGKGPLDIEFILNPHVQDEIDQEIRTRRQEAFRAEGIDKPDWRKLDEGARLELRERRAKVQQAIRLAAYKARGIDLSVKDLGSEPEDAESLRAVEQPDDPNSPDEVQTTPPRLGRLIRQGQGIPFNLLEPAPVPAKWKRLHLRLPNFEWAANVSGSSLSALIADYRQTLAQAIQAQLVAWLQSEDGRDAWRDLSVQPADTADRAAWENFLERARSIRIDATRVLPDLSSVMIGVERQIDFLNPAEVSFRVTLDNQSLEITGRNAQSLCNSVFGTGLTVRVPANDHRMLRLDRVEPSYRFRHYLHYPALGLNCGVEAAENGEWLNLTTTWAPRFVQPRIVPTNISVPCDFGRLASDAFQVSELLELPDRYKRWIKASGESLKDSVRAGLPPPEADIESQRLAEDIAGQYAEADYIERGVRLLVESQEAASKLANETDPARRAFLQKKAHPWLAWKLTNESFYQRDGKQEGRGWRLFQLAFILAHIPTFVSRDRDFQRYYEPRLDEDSAQPAVFSDGWRKI